MKCEYLLLLMIACGCHKASNTKRAAPYVSIAAIEQHTVPLYIDAIGQTESPSIIQVRPLVGGRLLASHAEEGAEVKEGDLLYDIDPRPFQAAVDQAKAILEKDLALLAYADKAVERYKKVVEEDYLSLLNFEQYESNAKAAYEQVETDRAALAAAELNLEFCSVKAPVAGKLGELAIDIGNIVIANDTNPITTLLPYDPIDITFSLPQSQFELIRHYQGNEGLWPFVAILPENPQLEHKGTCYFVDNQVDQDTGTILLKGELKNNDRTLWPGEFVRVKVLEKMLEQALIVPPGAILMGKDGPYLYAIDREKKAIAYNVTVLTRTDEYIAIQSDKLAAGDIVIIDGQINVASGMVVQTEKTSG